MQIFNLTLNNLHPNYTDIDCLRSSDITNNIFNLIGTRRAFAIIVSYYFVIVIVARVFQLIISCRNNLRGVVRQDVL